jgi:hypothetical protein
LITPVPRDRVLPPVVAHLQPLVIAREGRLPRPFDAIHYEAAYVPGGAMFTLWHGVFPLATCGVAWTEAGARAIWEPLEEMYLRLSDELSFQMAAVDVPCRPPQLPWLAEVRQPGFSRFRREVEGWLDDCERCLAWSIIQTDEARPPRGCRTTS